MNVEAQQNAATMWFLRLTWAWSAGVIKLCWIAQHQEFLPKWLWSASIPFCSVVCGFAVFRLWRAEDPAGDIWTAMNLAARLLSGLVFLFLLRLDFVLSNWRMT